MSDGTAIEWTDTTWNVARGCTKVSAGCKHCYAETFAERFRGVPGHPFERGFDFRLVPDAILLPYRWRRPRRVFVNSMSDLFHEDMPDGVIENVFATIVQNERHTFQILTKRAERMRQFFSGGSVMRNSLRTHPPKNVWLGVSVENQAAADERIPHLLATRAAVRFLSCEPLLGPVDLSRYLAVPDLDACGLADDPLSASLLYDGIRSGHADAPRRLGWVIAGGESGAGARPMHPDWARALRDQCQAAGVPHFFKQWGGWRPFYDSADDPDARALPKTDGRQRQWLNLAGGQGFHGERVVAVERLGKKRAGRILDGREWSEMPGASR